MGQLGFKLGRNNASVQSMTGPGWDTVEFEKAYWQEGATFWQVANPTRIDIPKTGWWLFCIGLRVQRAYLMPVTRLKVNGTTVKRRWAWMGTTRSVVTFMNPHMMRVYLEAGDYVEVDFYGDAAFDLAGNDEYAPSVSGHYWGDGPTVDTCVKLLRTTDFNYPGSGYHEVPFDTEIKDTDGFADLVADNTKITIPAGLGGIYLVQASFKTGVVAGSNVYFADTQLNGTTLINGCQQTSATLDHELQLCSVEKFSVADYVKLQGYCNVANGGLIATDTGPSFSLRRLDSIVTT